MKEQYKKPKFEIVHFQNEDVLTNSQEMGGDGWVKDPFVEG
jgi:hypothetical protein